MEERHVNCNALVTVSNTLKGDTVSNMLKGPVSAIVTCPPALPPTTLRQPERGGGGEGGGEREREMEREREKATEREREEVRERGPAPVRIEQGYVALRRRTP